MGNTGAPFEIAIDGTYRDRKGIAIEAATHLKTKGPHSEVNVGDSGTGTNNGGQAPARNVAAKGGDD